MKYFIDTEFLEGKQGKRFLGIKYGETKPTIDLISIGIVCEDGREYYVISKDFNLKEAWERYDLELDIDNGGMKKVYWIRENVLKFIYYDLCFKDEEPLNSKNNPLNFSYETLKNLISKYGKTNKQIAEEIKQFVGTKETIENWEEIKYKMNTQFYGYYSDYDWVVFCWLFGRMIDLPRGFPMYCIDLKQELDNYVSTGKKLFKTLPRQTNEHNALRDARWNYELYKFLQQL